MHKIKVIAGKPEHVSNKALVPVYWATGQSNKGRILVRFPIETQDHQAAAEIIVIRYLILEKDIYSGIKTGKNLHLQVSKGAIKKIQRIESKKHDLYDFGYQLLTRFADAIISVSKDIDWLPEENSMPLPPLCLDADLYRNNDMLNIKNLGEIRITRHALEKYREVCQTTDMGTTWKNLTRRLNANLVKINIPDRVLAHKYKKYGASPEVWNSQKSNLHYVFVFKDDHKVLVTVFARDPQEHLKVFRPGFENL